jgi:hypothetical protein
VKDEDKKEIAPVEFRQTATLVTMKGMCNLLISKVNFSSINVIHMFHHETSKQRQMICKHKRFRFMKKNRQKFLNFLLHA